MSAQHNSNTRLNKIVSHLSLNAHAMVNACNANNTSVSQYSNKVAVIMGAGNGLGGSIAKKFASHGFTVIVARRSKQKVQQLVDEINEHCKGGKCFGYGVDARNEEQVIQFINNVESRHGAIEFACYNIGANVRFNVADTTSRVYYKVWQMAAFGGFLFAKQVAKYMTQRGRGCIIFSGATASVRGKQGFAAFSGGKQALRALAQSMAKELAPKGIHIAHVIIDGGIDSEFIRNLIANEKKKGVDVPLPHIDMPDALLQPDEIAKNYWHIYQQKRNAWTFEMDLRPYCEKWT